MKKDEEEAFPPARAPSFYSDWRSRVAVWLAPWFLAVVIYLLILLLIYWGYDFPIGQKKRQREREFTPRTPSESNTPRNVLLPSSLCEGLRFFPRAVDSIWHCWPRFPRPDAFTNFEAAVAAAASLQFIYTLPPEMMSDYVCTYKKNLKKISFFSLFLVLALGRRRHGSLLPGRNRRAGSMLIVLWFAHKGILSSCSTHTDIFV